jgi:hypothetical protein
MPKIEPDLKGKELYNLINSGEKFDYDNPIVIGNDLAKVAFFENDGWVLRIPINFNPKLGFHEAEKHILLSQLDPTGENPDKAVADTLAAIGLMQVFGRQNSVLSKAEPSSGTSVPQESDSSTTIKCSLCHNSISYGVPVLGMVLQRAVVNGFDPFTNPEVDMTRVEAVCTSLGGTRQEWYRAWAAEALSAKASLNPIEDASRVCSTCFSAIKKAAFPKRWWQFWK